VQDPATTPPALIGRCARVREINALVRKLGRSDSPVLLLGETGTGKEVVARAIHYSGGHGPFVPIDCSLLGPLLESDLFGHTRGSFTGAVATKPGLLEVAEGGTAFFDEIGELPPDIQAKLLRVLQEKEFRALGALTGHKARFRVIAATNRDLAREVEAGRFRRLQKAPIRESRQTGETSRLAVVAGEQKPQTFVDTLVDQQPHQTRVSRSSLASSRVSKAGARETVGSPSRKSSSVSPPSR